MTRADAITVIKDLDVDEKTLTSAKEVLYDIGYSMQQLNVLRADYGEHTAQNAQKSTTTWVVESMMTEKFETVILNGTEDVASEVSDAIKNVHKAMHAVPSSNMPGSYAVDWAILANGHGIRFPYMGLNNG